MVATVAALIGMIPEGLILLTSTVLAVSVIRLSNKKVLVQELYCIETLARVDTLCLDKTGTITEGKMKVCKIIPDELSEDEITKVLAQFSWGTNDNNATIEAIKETYKIDEKWKIIKRIPFSSQKKWSGISFENKGSYVLGAPEMVLQKTFTKYKINVEEYAKENRVLVLGKLKSDFEGKELPKEIKVCGFILLCDIIKKEAKKTLNFFKKQGVKIKIISGDNPITVSNIAKRAGVDEYEKYIDASTLKTNEQIEEAVNKYTIFGRVNPLQKREIIKALKKYGNTVAMTGDGVNDVLALKEADCSIAMANGSDAARNVSQLVLLDSDFKSMPDIVAEGRRTINNIERSAQLFIAKTVYSCALAVLFVFINMPYPFKPIQLSLISMVTIGIPSFVLALQPNKEKVKGRFLKNILSKSVWSAIAVVFSVLITAVASYIFKLDTTVYSAICVILTAIIGFVLLFKLCKPFNILRSSLWISMVLIFILEITLFGDVFYMPILKVRNYLI